MITKRHFKEKDAANGELSNVLVKLIKVNESIINLFERVSKEAKISDGESAQSSPS